MKKGEINSTKLSSFSDLNSLKGLKLIHLNPCSIVRKFDLIRETIFGEINLDICCISETWMKPHQDNSIIAINGYN